MGIWSKPVKGRSAWSTPRKRDADDRDARDRNDLDREPPLRYDQRTGRYTDGYSYYGHGSGNSETWG